jgi:glycine/D-amino acid oxidase-like deaminating enzyme
LALQIDVLILGGGAAGLWLLDELHRRGFGVLLAEAKALGAGQTIASQGIIHGGIKYTLQGLFNRSAESIREMPERWRASLGGRMEPDLGEARSLSDCCYLWRTESLSSRAGLVGAKLALRTPVERVDVGDRPPALVGCPGEVLRVEEPVLDVFSLLGVFARRHGSRLVQVRGEAGVSFSTSGKGRIAAVALQHPTEDRTLTVEPRYVVLTAGEGNAGLRQKLGLSPETMQRRPLHMVMARGKLPTLYGHCVDGARTRVTITSVRDAKGIMVWQIGGQLAEDGVAMPVAELVTHARDELNKVLPGVDLRDVEWATYAIDRAEGRTGRGVRPEDVVVVREGSVVTAWPTKLALVPRLASLVFQELGERPSDGGLPFSVPDNWPRPSVAQPPWERNVTWLR